MSVSLQAIQEHIEKALVEVTQEKACPQTYSEILAYSFKVEFKKNCETLQALFKWTHTHRALLETNFLTLCAKRESEIQNTCFGFTASPDSLSNQLYWFIACELFQPKTLKEIILILLPSIRQFLSIDVAYTLKENRPYPLFVFEELDFLTTDCLNEPLDIASAQQLGYYVLANDIIFPTKSIQSFNFTHQKECFKALERKYPQIHKKLYQYTEATKQLVLDIQQFEYTGATPKKRLIEFMQALTLAGARYTDNEEEAAIEASFAFNEFRSYLKTLPKTLRHNLHNMNNDNKLTLKMIIHNLKNPEMQAGCVEINANHIKQILQNPSNQALLLQRPVVTQEQAQIIIQRYHKKSLPVYGTEKTNKIPNHVLKKLLNYVKIDKELQCIEFLKNLSIDEYPILLNNCALRFETKWVTSLLLLPEEKITNFRKLLLEDYEHYNAQNKSFIKAFCNLDIEYSDEESSLEVVENPNNIQVQNVQGNSTIPSSQHTYMPIITGAVTFIFTTLALCGGIPSDKFIYGILATLFTLSVTLVTRDYYRASETNTEADAPNLQPQIS